MKGFTLIELLVVVLIIGILAAVALPQYTKAVEKARSTEAIQLLGQLANAENIYQMGMGSYTNDLSLLDVQLPGLSNTTGVIATKNFIITVPSSVNTGSTFTAYAERASANSSGVMEVNTSEPKYALMLNIDASGTITRNCQETTSNTTVNKMCKSIANNSDGKIK